MSEKTQIITKLVEDIISATDIDCDISIEEDADGIHVDLRGEELGILIGKDGNTLDSIEFILGIAANRGQEERSKVFLDIEGYKSRKKERIEEMSKQAAEKVEQTGEAMSLSPMNPYERRLVHMVLKESTAVITESIGEEPERHIVIKPI
ncbi:MAG: KH domain-containing protein [Actinobacteria bacterium]|nr:MAG: KH domain-containing protein [Actinomycetota bacterium]